MDEGEAGSAARAARVAEALAWMLGDDDGDLTALHQAGLQQFLWYDLPFKWWLAPEDRRALLVDLAGHLEAAGLDRYAAVCRSDETAAVLAAWDRGADTGFERFRAAGERSGVVPPDTPALAWGDEMGPVELGAFWSASMALEVADAAGELRPGAPGWRRRQVAVVEAHLAAAGGWWGEPPLQAVLSERIERWPTSGRGVARRQLLEPVANQLLAEPAVPRTSGGGLTPVRRLLAAASGTGVRLTPTGRLPRAVVEDLGALVPAEARRLLLAPRLVRTHRGHLVTTARGDDLAARPSDLWRAVAPRWLDDAGFDAAAGELGLAQALVEPDLPADRVVAQAAVALTEDGWRQGGSGRPVPLADVAAALDGLAATGRALGWVSRTRAHRGRLVLTAAGRAAARATLRHRATRPVRLPGRR